MSKPNLAEMNEGQGLNTYYVTQLLHPKTSCWDDNVNFNSSVENTANSFEDLESARAKLTLSQILQEDTLVCSKLTESIQRTS